MSKAILLITYYWPPSGGAGVQRWLKLTNYLAEQGFEIHVLTPRFKDVDVPSTDLTLLSEISSSLKIHHTRTIEPSKLWSKILGKKSVPKVGFADSDRQNWKQKLGTVVRSRLFIPDPRILWKYWAVKRASQIIMEYCICTIVTSSPPHSIQTIGLKLKQKFKLNWICDLRDLWTDLYYYEALSHSKRSNQKNKDLERLAITCSDKVVLASPTYLSSYQPHISDKSKFKIIPNGFDDIDFKNFKYERQVAFTIGYTGSISEQYPIEPFIKSISSSSSNGNIKNFNVKFVGTQHDGLRTLVSNYGLSDSFTFGGYVTHSESISVLEESYILLLLGPLNKSGLEGGIPAKVFEYIASGRKIIYIGKPDGFVAEILSEFSNTFVFDEDILELENKIIEWHNEWIKHPYGQKPDENLILKYSRKEQAKQYAQLL